MADAPFDLSQFPLDINTAQHRANDLRALHDRIIVELWPDLHDLVSFVEFNDDGTVSPKTEQRRAETRAEGIRRWKDAPWRPVSIERPPQSDEEWQRLESWLGVDCRPRTFDDRLDLIQRIVFRRDEYATAESSRKTEILKNSQIRERFAITDNQVRRWAADQNRTYINRVGVSRKYIVEVDHPDLLMIERKRI